MPPPCIDVAPFVFKESTLSKDNSNQGSYYSCGKRLNDTVRNLCHKKRHGDLK